jgi:hypothetical protein
MLSTPAETNPLGAQVKHSIRDMSRGQYQVLYYPALATSHKVDIKYNGLTVAGSPIVLQAKNPATGKVSSAGKGCRP